MNCFYFDTTYRSLAFLLLLLLLRGEITKYSHKSRPEMIEENAELYHKDQGAPQEPPIQQLSIFPSWGVLSTSLNILDKVEYV